jgi:uncharacterized membrane protein YkvA (DUF1232 family)
VPRKDRDEDEERAGGPLKEALLFVPSVAKLVTRLARDPGVPRSVKGGLVAFGAYLACPIDLIPDWLPVVGYLDDIGLIALVGRWVIKRIPPALVEKHWDGQRPFPEIMAQITTAARHSVPEPVRRRLHL